MMSRGANKNTAYNGDKARTGGDILNLQESG